jgi:plasmid replication initiation protein
MPFSENKNQVIRKSNELIEARYKLSLAEQRVVLLLASEISPNDEDFKDYEIRVADFAEMFGLQTDKSLYEKVQNASDSLLGRTLQLSTDVNTSRKTAWLSYVEYVKGSGVVKLRFDKSLKPYLLQLKGHYTQYQFNYVMNFKSQYSMRLYEILKMDAFKANKNWQFEKNIAVLELRSIFGIDKKDYPLFANFKQKVIQPATSEVSDKTDLIINNVQYGKTGRKITNITFFVGIRTEQETKLRQANLRIEDIKPEKESENHPVIDTLVSLGFSFEIAKAYHTKHGVKKIERNIAYTLAKNQEKPITNIPAYLNSAIEQDYGGAWDIENQKKEEKKKEVLAIEKAKKLEEEKKKKAVEEQYKRVLDCFYALPDGVQSMSKESFISGYEKGGIVSNEWAKSEKENKNPLDKLIIKGAFIKFLIDKKICS